MKKVLFFKTYIEALKFLWESGEKEMIFRKKQFETENYCGWYGVK